MKKKKIKIWILIILILIIGIVLFSISENKDSYCKGILFPKCKYYIEFVSNEEGLEMLKMYNAEVDSYNVEYSEKTGIEIGSEYTVYLKKLDAKLISKNHNVIEFWEASRTSIRHFELENWRMR